MRHVLFISILAFASAIPAHAELPLARADFVRCMSHVERASQAAMFNKPFRDEVKQAMACDVPNASQLSPAQLDQLSRVFAMLEVQIEAPSATAHMQVIQEVQAFLRILE